MTQKVVEVFPGCKIIDTCAGKFMAGAPSDILKVLLRRKIEVPDKIILPDIFYNFGVVQANLEFPLYYNIFFRGNQKKLTLIGNQKELKRAREILRLSLFGPSEVEMRHWRIPEPIVLTQMALKEYLGIKMMGGEAIIDDLVDFIPFKDSQAEVGGIKIQHLDTNIFKLVENGAETLIDINLAEKQPPPLAIPAPQEVIPRSIFGAVALTKCTNGFDPTGYTTALLIWINGLGISLDATSWMREHLAACGINPHEIRAHIVTHIHDDHSNILDLVVNGKPFVLISDRLNYECFCSKAALILDMANDDIKKIVRFLEVTPEIPIDWYGAKIEIWPTAHPIPTFGVRISMAGKSICFSSDTLWGEKLRGLRERGTMPEDFCEVLENMPTTGNDLVFHDAGGGAIHPNPVEIAELSEIARCPIVPTHLAAIPRELSDKLVAATTGKSWELIPQKSLNAGDIVQALQSPAVKGLSDDWKSVIISRAEMRDFPPGQTIAREGEAGKNFYLIIAGSTEVLHDDEIIAELSTGDFFGEMSLMYDVPCNATVKAKGPTKILAIPRDIFLQIAKESGLCESLSAIHRMRPLILRFPMLRSLPVNIQNEIYRCAEIRRFREGETILRKGEPGDCLYGISGGRVDVMAGGTVLATLYRGHIFGEMALLGNGIRNADVIAATDVDLIVLAKTDFEKLIDMSAMFRYQLEILMKSRR